MSEQPTQLPSDPAYTAPESTPAPTVPAPVEPAPAPAPAAEPAPEHKAGDVVRFSVENPYHDGGPTVEDHAGLVVIAEDGRIRVLDLGDVARLADFPADAVRTA